MKQSLSEVLRQKSRQEAGIVATDDVTEEEAGEGVEEPESEVVEREGWNLLLLKVESSRWKVRLLKKRLLSTEASYCRCRVV